jgi:hypothetical protein
VEEGQPALFGQRLTDVGLIPIVTGALPLPPHETRIPIQTSAKHIPLVATKKGLEIRRPPRPSITNPTTGIVKGSHGDRLSERLFRPSPAGAWLGPAVVMARVTVCVPVVPAAIEAGENMQVLLGSIPEQENATDAANTPVGTVGATVKE